MADRQRMLDYARQFAREHPDADAARVRAALLERFFLGEDRGLAEGAARAAGQGAGGEGLILTLLTLPRLAYNWLFFRKRLAGADSEVGAVIESLRGQGLLQQSPG